MKLKGFSIMLELLDEPMRSVNCTPYVLGLLSTISEKVLQWPQEVIRSSNYPTVKINNHTFQRLLTVNDTKQVLSTLLILRHAIEFHSGGETLWKEGMESHQLLEKIFELSQLVAVDAEFTAAAKNCVQALANLSKFNELVLPSPIVTDGFLSLWTICSSLTSTVTN